MWPLPETYTDAMEERPRQFIRLMQGLIATVEAAVANQAKHIEDRNERLAAAAQFYDSAWQLTDQTVLPPKTAGSDVAEQSKAARILQEAHSQQVFADSGITTSTWLILESLLGSLLDDSRTPPETLIFENQAKLLLAGQQGAVERMDVQSFAGSSPGVLLDPLAFGPTTLDEDLQKSLWISWRCAKQSLLAKQTGDAQVPAIRLTPQLPNHVPGLAGPSAGGLFAIALLATARQQPLDLSRSASVAIDVSPAALAAEFLKPEDIQLARVGKVARKLTEGAAVHYGLKEVALHADDVRRFQQHLSHLNVEITPVTTLAELLTALRGDARHEQHLDDLCRAITEQWDMLCQPGDAERYYADEHEAHRFDCYLGPKYVTVKPGTEKQRSAPVVAEMTSGMEEAEPVPGVDDECLFHLLQQLMHGPKNLVVYDRAGAGKTMFSWRMRHVAAESEAKSAIFGRRSPLIVRFDGRWPVGADKSPLPLKQALLRDRTLTAAIDDPDERLACIEYALKAKRIVIILDGFDQFPQSHRQHFFDLQETRADNQTIRDGCHWIVTTREHLVRHFDHSHWMRVPDRAIR